MLTSKKLSSNVGQSKIQKRNRKKFIKSNLLQADFEDYDKFPKKIPIVSNGRQLGSLIIDITAADSLRESDRNIFLYAEDEFWDNDLIRSQLDCAMAHGSAVHSPSSQLGFFGLYFHFALQDLRITSYLGETDEDILRTIRAFGSVALSISPVQKRLAEWLSDKDTANIKLSKLKDALLNFTYGDRFKDRPFKQGSPGIVAFTKYGSEWFKRAYEALMSILRIAKTEIRKNEGLLTKDIIDKSYNSYLDQEMLRTAPDKDGGKGGLLLAALDLTKVSYRAWGPAYNPISTCIDSDEVLKSEFLRGAWEPNKLAKEILSKILGISLEKTSSILYRKQLSADK